MERDYVEKGVFISWNALRPTATERTQKHPKNIESDVVRNGGNHPSPRSHRHSPRRDHHVRQGHPLDAVGGARTANGIEGMPLANMMVAPRGVPMRPRGGVVTAITNDVRFDVFRVFLCSLRGGRSERVP